VLQIIADDQSGLPMSRQIVKTNPGEPRARTAAFSVGFLGFARERFNPENEQFDLAVGTGDLSAQR